MDNELLCVTLAYLQDHRPLTAEQFEQRRRDHEAAERTRTTRWFYGNLLVGVICVALAAAPALGAFQLVPVELQPIVNGLFVALAVLVAMTIAVMLLRRRSLLDADLEAAMEKWVTHCGFVELSASETERLLDAAAKFGAVEAQLSEWSKCGVVLRRCDEDVVMQTIEVLEAAEKSKAVSTRWEQLGRRGFSTTAMG